MRNASHWAYWAGIACWVLCASFFSSILLHVRRLCAPFLWYLSPWRSVRLMDVISLASWTINRGALSLSVSDEIKHPLPSELLIDSPPELTRFASCCVFEFYQVISISTPVRTESPRKIISPTGLNFQLELCPTQISLDSTRLWLSCVVAWFSADWNGLEEYLIRLRFKRQI